MFVLISLLYFVLSALLYQINSPQTKILDFLLITFVFYIIITYIFYMYIKKQEQFEEIEQIRSIKSKNKNANSNDDINVDNENPIFDQKVLSETNNLEDDSFKEDIEISNKKENKKENEKKIKKQEQKIKSKTKKIKQEEKQEEKQIQVSCEDNPQLEKACKDKWKGYIPHNTLKKINEIPDKLNKDILPSLKTISQNQSILPSDQNQNNKETNDDDAFLDMIHIQENPDIYSKLKVLKNLPKNSKDINIDNIDLKKMENISKKMEKINYVLFAFKKYTPDLYNKIMNKFL